MRLDARALLSGALVVSVVATLGSLSLTGVGPTGWRGVGLYPCELCWYQRILMYPIPVLLGVALARRDDRGGLYALPLAAAGFLVAGYHVFLQANPSAEVGSCYVGSCTVVDWRFMDLLTVPQLSLIAFTLVVLLLGASLRRPQERV